MAIRKAKRLPVCGSTSGDPSRSLWSPTTLESNTLVMSTPSTSYKRSKNITSARSKKKVNDTVDSPSSGITQARRYISRCQNTSKMLSSASSTLPRLCHNINRTPTFIRHMGQKCSIQWHPTTPFPSTSWARNLFRKSKGYFCYDSFLQSQFGPKASETISQRRFLYK